MQPAGGAVGQTGWPLPLTPSTTPPSHPNGVVCRGRVERRAVGGGGQRSHAAAVPLERAPAVPVCGAPHPHRAVVRAAVQQAAVGAEGQGQHRRRVPCQRVEQLRCQGGSRLGAVAAVGAGAVVGGAVQAPHADAAVLGAQGRGEEEAPRLVKDHAVHAGRRRQQALDVAASLLPTELALLLAASCRGLGTGRCPLGLLRRLGGGGRSGRGRGRSGSRAGGGCGGAVPPHHIFAVVAAAQGALPEQIALPAGWWEQEVGVSPMVHCRLARAIQGPCTQPAHLCPR